MNLKKLFRIKLAAMLLAIFAGTFVMSEVADAAYPSPPTFSSACMYFNQLEIYDDANVRIYRTTASGCGQRANPTTEYELVKGSTYRLRMYGSYMGSICCYPQFSRGWVDWNGDEDWEDPGERIWSNTYHWAWSPSFYFTVPDIAEGNTFLLRICSRYFGFGSTPHWTGVISSGYGDYADVLFTVPRPPSDAGVTEITQPSGVMTLGTQNIAVNIRNYEVGLLESLSIVWRIDEGETWYDVNTMSHTFTWTGSLGQDEEEEVIVGTWDFNEFRKYTIDAFCEAPNGEIDIDPSNDAAMQRIVGPALSPTTYYIGAFGGSSNTFPTISDATAYLSGAGVAAGGTITFEFPIADPGPAVYQGPINIGAYPVPPGAEVNVVIKSASGNPEHVIIEFEPDAGTPYLMTIGSANNIGIEGLTFNSGTVTGGYGGIMDFQDCNGVSVTNNIFENVVGADAGNNHTSVNIGDSYDVTIDGNEFKDGAIAINEASFCPRKIQVTNNFFYDATWKFIQLYGIPDGSPCTENDILIDGNVFSGAPTPNGILSTNGTEITNNSFSWFTGVVSTDAVVYVNNIDPANFTGQTTINNNSMTGSINDINGIFAEDVPDLRIEENEIIIEDAGFASTIATNGMTITGSGNTFTPVYIYDNEVAIDNAFDNNGVFTDNSNVRINYCDIDITALGGTLYSVYLNNSTGYIANSQIGAVNAYSMYLNNSDMGVYYNAIANQSSMLPALRINSGTNTVMRNLVQNMLAGPAIVASGAGFNTIDENNYYSKDGDERGPELGNWGGIGCTDLAAWQTASGQDANSSSIEIVFVNFSEFNLELYTFNEFIVFDTPIDFSASPGWEEEVQETDYLGQTRYSYFMGSNNIVPEVFITTQPTGIMDCFGEDATPLGVTAYVTRSVQARYEWYKDDVSLREHYTDPADDWADKATLYLDRMPFAGEEGLSYEMEGAYRCLIRGSGAEPKWSDYVLVNVLSQAEITRQPEGQRVNLGDHLLLEVEAHIVADEGRDDPFYQPEVQWYRGSLDDSVKNDFGVDGHYSGAQSTILSIRNVTADEIGDNYFVVLTGRCNVLISDDTGVMLFPSVYITEHPANANVCEGQPVTFDVTAAPSDTFEVVVTYQWRKDSIAIVGATESSYTIDSVSLDDVAVYDCVVMVLPGEATEVSEAATLNVKTMPVITTQPEGLTVVTSASFSLSIETAGVVTYQWYLEGNALNSATISTYTVASATFSDGGAYTCEVTNECGSVMSDAAIVVVEEADITGVDDMINGGFRLAANTPNPFNETSKIRFYAPASTSVRISITNVYGQEVALLVDDVYSGWNYVEVNASQYKLSSGVYYYTMTSNSYSITRKMVVVR